MDDWRIGVLAVTGHIYYYIINSIIALAHSETFYIVGNIILLYKIKWLRDGKRWYRDICIKSHHLY